MLDTGVSFPGETEAYRQARNKLLQAEAELRSKAEEVAALRRSLPLGGRVRKDYGFSEQVDGHLKTTRLSELFEDGKPSLLLYSYMYGPQDSIPCPMCTSFLDSLDGAALHITQRSNLAIVTSGPVERTLEIAAQRDWKNLRLLSVAGSDYNRDYHGEDSDGRQLPMCNVFTKVADDIHHFWASELFFVPSETHPRHVDLLWPLWHAFDLLPEGRGGDWLPQLSYDA